MDERLDQTLQAAVEGDPEAWRRLIQTYSGRVYGLLLKQCGSSELAEELTQVAFVKVVDKLGSYEDVGRFEAWLFRIAMNCLRDEMRRRKRQAAPMDFDATPPESIGMVRAGTPSSKPLDQLERAEEVAQLRQAVAALPESDRQVIEMHYTAGLTFAQIAEVLEQPLGTVLARGHRAVKKLKTMLAKTAR